MKKVKKGVLGLGVLAVSILSLNSCDFSNWGRTNINSELSSGNDVQSFSELTYNYNASSVDPEFHRSYSIQVTDTVVSTEIKDYDTVLLHKEINLTPDQKDQLLGLIQKISDTGDMELISESGSDAEAMVVLDSGKPVMQLNWNTNETEEVTQLKGYLKALFGDYDELVNSTIPRLNPIIEQSNDSLPETELETVN